MNQDTILHYQQLAIDRLLENSIESARYGRAREEHTLLTEAEDTLSGNPPQGSKEDYRHFFGQNIRRIFNTLNEVDAILSGEAS